jgi:hypothetical protein
MTSRTTGRRSFARVGWHHEATGDHMNARTIVHALLLAIAGVLAYGGALLLLSSCDSVQSPLSGPRDSGPPSKALDAGYETSAAPPSADASPGSAVEGGARETSTPDAPPSLHVPPEGGKPDGGARETPDAYCSGWTDAGYLEIDGSSGFVFQVGDAGSDGGQPCSGFGCWFACPEGPCPQSSDCPIGLVCIVSRDASLANPGDTRGTCARLP